MLGSFGMCSSLRFLAQLRFSAQLRFLAQLRPLMQLNGLYCGWLLGSHYHGLCRGSHYQRSLRDTCLGLSESACCAGVSLGACGHAAVLDAVEDGGNDWFWVKAVYFLDECAGLVVDGGVGEGGGADVVHAELGVPLAVEVVDLEAPLPGVLELVEDGLEVAAIGAVGGEVFHEFEGLLVLLYLRVELLVADQARVRHVPLLRSAAEEQRGQP